jgi:hypothetical protein
MSAPNRRERRRGKSKENKHSKHERRKSKMVLARKLDVREEEKRNKSAGK